MSFKRNFAEQLFISLGLSIVLVVYAMLVWPALSGPFVFDDFPNLQNLQILGTDVSGNLGRYLAAFIGSPGRPISALSFLINDTAWPSNPFSFKYTNLMIHLLNGVFLFGLLRQLAKACPILPQSSFWPLLAMAAWLFHPLQLSAQMLVVQRMTLLSATFCFIGLWSYITLLQRAKSLTGDFIALSALGICTILAFLCKENGALLPLFAWALNATLLRQALEDKNLASRRLLQIGCIVPSLLLFTSIVYMGTRPEGFINREFNMVERLMTQMHVLADYLRYILMPRLSGSGIYFDDYPITRSWTQPTSTLLLTIGFGVSLALAIAKRKQFPILSFSILWFFAGHAMESTILNLELYFEHRNYLPMLGPLVALSAWTLLLKIRNFVGIFLFVLWLALIASITKMQAQAWGNAEILTTLWEKERPLSLRAAQEVAKYRYDIGLRQEAFDGILQAYDRGIQGADLPMAGLIAKCWNPEIVTNRNLYQETIRAIKSSSHSNSALTSLQLLRESAQSIKCSDIINENQWVIISEKMLENPNFQMPSEAFIRVERAKLFIHQRNLDSTMVELERAYAVEPSIELTQKIAEVLISAGLFDEAKLWLRKGIALKKPWFEEWMANDKKISKDMLVALEKLDNSKTVNSEH